MHDVKAIRDDPDAYRRAWSLRGVEDAFATVDAILDLDQQALRAAQTALQSAQSRRNEALLIGAAKAAKDEARAAELMAEVEALKGEMAAAFRAGEGLAGDRTAERG